jgi:hypothetical protein
VQRGIIVLAFLALAPAGVSPAAAARTSGIKGVVLNTTCPGPCRYPPPKPQPYTGSGLTVTVRRLPERRLVAVRQPTDGRFRIGVRKGRYRVKASVGGSEPACWQGEAKRVRVSAGQFTRVRLHVYNACIV